MHQALHPHGAELAYPANIVASQVDQHYVLGPLLLIGQQLLLDAQILFLVGRARTRSRDGPVLDVALLHAHQQFGRRAYQAGGRFVWLAPVFQAEAQEIQVRRGIDDAQSTVDGEGVDSRLHFKALRKHGLEDVTGGDVLLDPGDRGQKILLEGVAGNGEFAPGRSLPGLGRGLARRFSSRPNRCLASAYAAAGFWRERSAVTIS